MHTFASKQKPNHKTKSAALKTQGRGVSVQHPAVHPILRLQRRIGNQAVQQLLKANTEECETGSNATSSTCFVHDVSRIPLYPETLTRIQPKLEVNTPGNMYEQEADGVADQVMCMPEPPALRQAPPKNERIPIRAKKENSRVPEPLLIAESPIQATHGGGQPLPEATRGFFEPRFGHDFSQVRVHTDARAAESVRSVNALAYTVGRDIFFDPRQYAPETVAGKQLLAHELAHVAQQHPPSLLLRQEEKQKTPKLSGMRTIAETYINAYHTGAKSGLDLFLTDLQPDFDWGSFWLTVGGNVVWAAAAFATGGTAFIISLAGIATSTVASQNVVKKPPDFKREALTRILDVVNHLKNQVDRVTRNVHTEATSGAWDDNRVRKEILTRMFNPEYIRTFQGGFPSANTKAVAASVRESLLLMAAKEKGTTGTFGNIPFGPGYFQQVWRIDAIEYVQYPFSPAMPRLKPKSNWAYGLSSAKVVNVSPHFKDINKSLNEASRTMGRPRIDVLKWPIEKRLILKGANTSDPFYFEYHFDASNKLTKTVISSGCRAFLKVQGNDPGKYADGLLKMIQGFSKRTIPRVSSLG